jgi:pimeloyl-ACP methyl ester carboxylesterase
MDTCRIGSGMATHVAAWPGFSSERLGAGGTSARAAGALPFLGEGVSPQTVALMLGVAAVVLLAYIGLSVYVAKRLAYPRPLPIKATPGDLGMDFRDVAFTSRDDGIQLRGWLVPGMRPNGQPTLERTIIAVHGAWQNRTDPAQGLNELVCALARAGFAVLAFDMRGHGESDPAPFTLGDSERRDVLGAVDFLRHNVLPYPKLERPRWIGAWGVSVGAHAALYAAADEPAIQAVVADSAYADMSPTLARELPKQSRLPSPFTRGTLFAARTMYGVDGYAIRPTEVVARIAPRPVLFIQGGADTMNPLSSLTLLAEAAAASPDAQVGTWQVPDTDHAQGFHHDEREYVGRLVAFFDASSPDALPALPDVNQVAE